MAVEYKCQKRGDGQYLIIVTRRHWFRQPVIKAYLGNSTVWHDVETGRRAGTLLEGELAAERWLYDERRREMLSKIPR